MSGTAPGVPSRVPASARLVTSIVPFSIILCSLLYNIRISGHDRRTGKVRGDGEGTCGAGDHRDDVRPLRRRGEKGARGGTRGRGGRGDPDTSARGGRLQSLEDDRGDACECDRGGGIPLFPGGRITGGDLVRVDGTMVGGRGHHRCPAVSYTHL